MTLEPAYGLPIPGEFMRTGEGVACVVSPLLTNGTTLYLFLAGEWSRVPFLMASPAAWAHAAAWNLAIAYRPDVIPPR